jgi:ketosteroid isomerase-like protein
MTTVASIRAAFVAAAQSRDLDAILDCYAPDAVMIAPEGRFEGRDGIAAYFRPQFDAFSDLRLEITHVHDDGDTGVGEWTFSGTNSRPLELPDGTQLPATGRRVTQRGADVAVAVDGRIREHRLYYDQVELLQQLSPQASAV